MSTQPLSPALQQATQPTPPQGGQGSNFAAAVQIAVGLAQKSQGGLAGIVRGVSTNLVSTLVQNAQGQGQNQASGPGSKVR